MTLITY